MSTENKRGVRLDSEAIGELLDDLDVGGVDRQMLESRGSDRKRYRVERLEVEFTGPCGFTTMHAVPARNISRDGIGFLTGNFVYPGSRCRVRLTGANEVSDDVSGTVRWCRYVPGSRCVHEVGVQFDESIDIQRYRPESSIRVVIVEDNSSRRASIARLLQPLSVKLAFMTEAVEVHERIHAQQVDIVLLNLDLETTDAFEVGRGLRMDGFTRGIVGITTQRSPAVRRRALEAGFSDVLVRPLAQKRVAEVVESLRVTGAHSPGARGSQPQNELVQYTEALSGQAADMERAFAFGDVAALRSLIEQVRGDATQNGFETITCAAAAVAETMDGAESLSRVRERLNDLVRWCLAARPIDDGFGGG